MTDVVLAGFSMGTGEVGRYLGTYGPARIDKAVFIAALEPFLLKTDDNPDRRRTARSSTALASRGQRPVRLLHQFYADVYNTDETLGTRISERLIESSWKAACSGVGLCLGRRGDHAGRPTSAPISPRSLDTTSLS